MTWQRKSQGGDSVSSSLCEGSQQEVAGGCLVRDFCEALTIPFLRLMRLCEEKNETGYAMAEDGTSSGAKEGKCCCSSKVSDVFQDHFLVDFRVFDDLENRVSSGRHSRRDPLLTQQHSLTFHYSFSLGEHHTRAAEEEGHDIEGSWRRHGQHAEWLLSAFRVRSTVRCAGRRERILSSVAFS